MFRILAISALGQLLIDLTMWSLVGRGKSKGLLKLLLVISPILICGFVIGLPFGIKGVALSGSLVLIGISPWILKFSFQGTQLTLKRVGEVIVCPIILSVAGVLVSELALRFVGSGRPVPQLLVTALGFAGTYLLSLLIPRVRREILSFRDLASHFAFLKQANYSIKEISPGSNGHD